jgi:hypothetical protein
MKKDIKKGYHCQWEKEMNSLHKLKISGDECSDAHKNSPNMFSFKESSRIECVINDNS